MGKLLILLVFGFTVSLSAQVAPRNVTGYEVKFTIRNAGLAVDGSFAGLNASIRFDPANLGESKIQASVDVATVNTGIELRDKHLLGREYFDAGRFPGIEIRSEEIKVVGKNKYEGVFTVNIRDKIKEIAIPFTVSRKGRNTVFRGDFKIDRREFGIGKRSVILSDEVTIRVTITTSEDTDKRVSMQ